MMLTLNRLYARNKTLIIIVQQGGLQRKAVDL